MYVATRPNIIIIPPSQEDLEMMYSFAFKNTPQNCVDYYTVYSFHRLHRTGEKRLNKHNILVTVTYI